MFQLSNQWREIIILILVALVVFFATKNYRNEQVLAQAQEIQRMNGVLQQTNILLNQVAWNAESVSAWKQLGYTIQPRVGK